MPCSVSVHRGKRSRDPRRESEMLIIPDVTVHLISPKFNSSRLRQTGGEGTLALFD